jgi:acyl-homoserine lactone acylase PvdQ
VGKHDTRSLIAMQYDQTTTFAAKLKKMFAAPGMSQPLKQAIAALPAADGAKAREAFTRLMAFDGKLSPTSADAAIYELFLQESAKQIFLDELGPESSPAWKAFIANGKLSYAAQADHLLGREDSPFWDDVRTAQKEDKPTILARSLAAAISAGTVNWAATTKPGSGANCTATNGRMPLARPCAVRCRPAAITPRSTRLRSPGARTSTPRWRLPCALSSTSARPNR